jgi:plastocyanin
MNAHSVTKKTTLVASMLVLVLAVAAGCSSSAKKAGTADTSGPSSSGETSSSPAPGGSSTTASVPPAGANGVNIVDYAFSPQKLTVKVGTTVSWINQDQFEHEVASKSGDPGLAFDLGKQGHGVTVTHTFTAPGTYEYICNIHNYMTGTIVVTK